MGYDWSGFILFLTRFDDHSWNSLVCFILIFAKRSYMIKLLLQLNLLCLQSVFHSFAVENLFEPVDKGDKRAYTRVTSKKRYSQEQTRRKAVTQSYRG